MELVLKLLWPVMAIGSIYALWREYKARAPLLSLLKWLSAFVMAAGICLDAYGLWSFGGKIGWVGQLLFLVFAIVDSLRKNS